MQFKTLFEVRTGSQQNVKITERTVYFEKPRPYCFACRDFCEHDPEFFKLSKTELGKMLIGGVLGYQGIALGVGGGALGVTMVADAAASVGMSLFARFGLGALGVFSGGGTIAVGVYGLKRGIDAMSEARLQFKLRKCPYCQHNVGKHELRKSGQISHHEIIKSSANNRQPIAFCFGTKVGLEQATLAQLNKLNDGLAIMRSHLIESSSKEGKFRAKIQLHMKVLLFLQSAYHASWSVTSELEVTKFVQQQIRRDEAGIG